MAVKRTRKLVMVKRDYVLERKVSPDFNSKKEAKQFAKRAKNLGYAGVQVESLGKKWIVRFF